MFHNKRKETRTKALDVTGIRPCGENNADKGRERSESIVNMTGPFASKRRWFVFQMSEIVGYNSKNKRAAVDGVIARHWNAFRRDLSMLATSRAYRVTSPASCRSRYRERHANIRVFPIPGSNRERQVQRARMHLTVRLLTNVMHARMLDAMWIAPLSAEVKGPIFMSDVTSYVVLRSVRAINVTGRAERRPDLLFR